MVLSFFKDLTGLLKLFFQVLVRWESCKTNSRRRKIKVDISSILMFFYLPERFLTSFRKVLLLLVFLQKIKKYHAQTMSKDTIFTKLLDFCFFF